MTRPIDNVVDAIDKWWRAANFLCVGQIYLEENPLLQVPLAPHHVKRRIKGQWNTAPGLNFIYAHLTRVVRSRGRKVLFVTGLPDSASALIANSWLEGTYSEIYPNVSQDIDGMREMFRQSCYHGMFTQHASPQIPGALHEGADLGYSLAHAYGAALDNPELIVACVVGDREAEGGPLSASWQSNKFLNPETDGAVLPILHVSSSKTPCATVLSSLRSVDRERYLQGMGYSPIFVKVSPCDPVASHRRMLLALDQAFDAIQKIQLKARAFREPCRPSWPMIVVYSPKGWTAPALADGLAFDESRLAQQLPFADAASTAYLHLIETWMRSYDPCNLFEVDGRPKPVLQQICPSGADRISAIALSNGGGNSTPLRLPDPSVHAVFVETPGGVVRETTLPLGAFLSDVLVNTAMTRDFRIFSPGDITENGLAAVLDASPRAWIPEKGDRQANVSTTGRAMEMYSEHTSQGWLEGFVLSGRHGFLSAHEAFARNVDSMLNQHTKWCRGARETSWRRALPSLNYHLTSRVWCEDPHSLSHQDAGVIDLIANKPSGLVQVYLPPDANCLLYVAQNALQTWNRVNIIITARPSAPQWLSYDAAVRHCQVGAGIWPWAGNGEGDASPDIVLACAGDVPTYEMLAAAALLRAYLPRLRVRFVNVVELLCLGTPLESPRGMSDAVFEGLFTVDRPVIFATHSYPSLIHRLVYQHRNHRNFHVHGLTTITTAMTTFDMAVRNQIDRYHLCQSVLRHLDGIDDEVIAFKHFLSDILLRHRLHIDRYGEDLDEVRSWSWTVPLCRPDVVIDSEETEEVALADVNADKPEE